MQQVLIERKTIKSTIAANIPESLRVELEDYLNDYDANITDVIRTAVSEYLLKRKKSLTTA